MATLTSKQLSGDWTMEQVLRVFPSAQRLLSQKYHINPLVAPSTVGFQPADSLAAVAKTIGADVNDIVEQIEKLQDRAQDLEISPRDAAELVKAGAVRLLDVREPRAYAVARIPGSQRIDQALAEEIVRSWAKDTPLVLVCHHGVRTLDAADYLRGHGFSNVKSLSGGIDAWSLEIDPSVPRY
jgi:rhodanese-related sulfurtransferase